MFTTHFKANEDVQEANLENLTYQEVAHDLCLNIVKTRDSGEVTEPAKRSHPRARLLGECGLPAVPLLRSQDKGGEATVSPD